MLRISSLVKSVSLFLLFLKFEQPVIPFVCACTHVFTICIFVIYHHRASLWGFNSYHHVMKKWIYILHGYYVILHYTPKIINKSFIFFKDVTIQISFSYTEFLITQNFAWLCTETWYKSNFQITVSPLILK